MELVINQPINLLMKQLCVYVQYVSKSHSSSATPTTTDPRMDSGENLGFRTKIIPTSTQNIYRKTTIVYIVGFRFI